ncbi:MAG: DUF3426 domain-containing protein [Candidatus Binatia bacterium]|nr:DUF3426 domain-containing protein [Candidatus Binatia bacterium]
MIPEFEFGEEEEFTLDPENKDFDAVEASEPIRQKPEKRRPSNGRTRGSTVASDDLGQFRTLVFLLCVVVGFYAVLTTSLFARPDRAQALITQIPVVGQGIGEERLWARRVRLEGVEASTQQTKDGRPVLVITGRAVNTAPNPLQAVQLSAELLRADGKVVDEKTVFLGNMVSARVLRDLTPQEISILQQLSPPKQFAIPPGESASFAIVFFLDATRQGDSRRVEEGRYPSEFRLRVVTARRQG